jgi:hypothetical protein
MCQLRQNRPEDSLRCNKAFRANFRHHSAHSAIISSSISRKTKVCQHNTATEICRCDEDVLLLDVAMSNALRMHVLQGESNLLGNDTGIVIVNVPTVGLGIRVEIACWCEVGEYVSVRA